MTKAEMVVQTAEQLIGSPYVYGAWGDPCTVKLRKKYAALRPTQAATTFARCQRLRDKNQKDKCDGCAYRGLLAFDCRGFTRYCLKAAEIEISGQSVATQWSGKNWAEKGTIDSLPDLVCCVFIRSGRKWKHIGLHIGDGSIIHCSGEVKRDTVGGQRKWTHYAIPAGLYTENEIKNARRVTPLTTLKKGSSGPAVRELQEMLNALGFDCGSADGIFGAKTQAAVKAFQFANGLQYDGIAGPNTLEVLAARAAAPEEPEEKPDDEPVDLVGVGRDELAAFRDSLLALVAQINEYLMK